jgi:ribokinase
MYPVAESGKRDVSLAGLRFAVVGHAEWAHFLEVPAVPRQGEIVEAGDTWTEAAGGGAVAAVQLAKLAGGAAFLTAVGSDEAGRLTAEQLRSRGVEVHAAPREEPQRRAVVFLDADGERTIAVFRRRLHPHRDDDLPWGGLEQMDGVYFTGGDMGALRAARAAKVLVATPRAREALVNSDVVLDALVRSAGDATEQDSPSGWSARVVVSTRGREGGTWETADGRRGEFPAAPLPGPPRDAYGAGDSFAAGFTYGLGAGMDLEAALSVGARCGAGVMAGRGPYEGQPTAEMLGVG